MDAVYDLLAEGGCADIIYFHFLKLLIVNHTILPYLGIPDDILDI